MYRFYPVLLMGKTDLFTQFYPVLPNWFYPMGKTYHANTAVMSKIGSRTSASFW